jgi:DNA primase
VIEEPAKIAQEGLKQLRARALEPRLRQIELALANAGADSNFDPISLLKERSELQRQLRQPIVLGATA